MSDLKNRKLKVYQTSYEVYNPQGYNVHSRKDVCIPQIRLQGKWLKECGFDIGSKCEAVCEDGRLTIIRNSADV